MNEGEYINNLPKEPFSLIRIGDGELLVIGRQWDKKSLCKFYMKEFGYVLSPEEHEETRNILIGAIEGADILGLPFGKEAKGGYWTGWYDTLDEYCPSWREKKHTDCNINTRLLHSGYLNDLLAGAENLNYISCRYLDEQFKTNFGIKNVNSFIIAPEFRFTSGYSGKKHFRDQFNDIKEWMRGDNFTGQLCLIGAGHIGKVYANWFRDRGGRCVDIGSVFDLWAGRLTRGEQRGKDVFINTFKL